MQTERNTAGFVTSLGADLVAIRDILALVDVLGADDFPRIVSLRDASVDVGGVGLGILVGGNGLVLKEVLRYWRGNVVGSNAENFSSVNVVAVLVNVGVIALQEALGLGTVWVSGGSVHKVGSN